MQNMNKLSKRTIIPVSEFDLLGGTTNRSLLKQSSPARKETLYNEHILHNPYDRLSNIQILSKYNLCTLAWLLPARRKFSLPWIFSRIYMVQTLSVVRVEFPIQYAVVAGHACYSVDEKQSGVLARTRLPEILGLLS